MLYEVITGVTMGHWHIVSKDVEANQKLFLAMSGELFMPGGQPVMRFPGLYINLRVITSYSIHYTKLYEFTTLAHLPWLGYVLTVAAVLALLTTILVVMALAGRALQASAVAGILPKALGKINEKTNTPVNAQLLVVLVVGVIAAFPSATNFIVNFGSLCNAIVVAIICLTIT